MHSVLAALAMFAVVDVGETFSSETAWRQGADEFAAEHLGEGFVFASRDRDALNCMERGAVTWLGREVWETRIYYAPTAGPRRVELSLFNQGDRRGGESFPMENVDRLVADIQLKYGAGAKTAPKPEKTKLKTGGFRCECVWRRIDPAVTLTWGVEGGDVQYVRAALTSGRNGAAKVRSVSAAAKAREHVRRDVEGDVWIDGVPMVDQGRKGYCAAAVGERILRYYGHDVDEHEFAQQAGCETSGGTSVAEMIKTVRGIGAKKHLAYERIVTGAGPFDSRELAVKDRRFRKFLSGVRTQIDKGIPICWGVTLGVFPEAGLAPQIRGGHMRLIVGYNVKSREIIYSDTWGAGHELKRMPEDTAFTITTDAFFLRPQ